MRLEVQLSSVSAPSNGERGLQARNSVATTIISIPKLFLLILLRGYKRMISPVFLPACRYVPSCSEYAAEAVERYGFVRGSVMSVWRLLRCHPFARGGFDPVPNQAGGLSHVILADNRRPTTEGALAPSHGPLHSHSLTSQSL